MKQPLKRPGKKPARSGLPGAGGTMESPPPKEVMEALGRARSLAAIDLTPVTRQPRGAVVLDGSGRTAEGSSVEFAERPGLSVCAEQVALSAAVIEKVSPAAIVIWTKAGSSSPWPCGACRQVLIELAPAAVLWLQVGDQPPMQVRVQALLPHAFGGEDLPVPPGLADR
ncbi:MAG: cytidine deaminase [Candidatus Eisenbacteria bacterium]|uniref:Cytidine deaminase n=1 Tax=Eiseniibacteriota bacterium TaxID=2212470 RepID=A0A948RT82_UNCEI|nr:cytidine deaminase [Candidatus Eisenbacteria bacterium]MBU1948845.1 cytidine deaminase [Candidatus Eisenbacteria bacterium]MBU2690575.1 cytidine deaminase [Candidatus Eisenbacteria bacterium]